MAARTPWWRGERGEWYVVAQVVVALVVLLAPRNMPSWPAWSGPWALAATVAGVLLMAVGLAFAVGAIVRLGPNLTPLPYPKDRAELVDTGPYAFVRHPIYSGVFFAAVGWALFVHGWLTLLYAVGAFVFVDMKSRREERWLAEKFGEPYADYQRRVHKLIPWVY